MYPSRFEYLAPTSVEEVIAALGEREDRHLGVVVALGLPRGLDHVEVEPEGAVHHLPARRAILVHEGARGVR